MQWFICRYKIITHTMGMLPFIFWLFVSSIVAKFDWLSAKCIKYATWCSFLPRKESDMIFGFPSWVLGVLVALIILYFKLLNYTVKLEENKRELELKSSNTNPDSKDCLANIGKLWEFLEEYDFPKINHPHKEPDILQYLAMTQNTYNATAYIEIDKYKIGVYYNEELYSSIKSFLGYFKLYKLSKISGFDLKPIYNERSDYIANRKIIKTLIDKIAKNLK